MKIGVVTFPGSNCDHDFQYAVKYLGHEALPLWHEEADLKQVDAVVLPGGFSYGDYLRCGAIARFSPIMDSVARFARDGGAVLGICNGFQILVESGLLPGALLKNQKLQFICKTTYLRVESVASAATSRAHVGQVLRIPIAHGDGNYFADESTLRDLEDNQQVVLRYTNPRGELDETYNFNGSLRAIAGISNRPGNVVGMMPHPERVVDEQLGKGTDGCVIIESFLDRAFKR